VYQSARTSLHGRHVAAGARMAPFAGWEMPMLYSGIVEEHRHVRSSAGLFDVSHMGNLLVRGDGASELLQRTLSNDIALATEGKAIYSHILDEEGRIIDDTIVYNLGQGYLLMPNAAAKDRVLHWMRAHADDAELLDLSSGLACLALQGPRAEEVLRPLMDLSALKRFRITRASLGLEPAPLPEAIGHQGQGLQCLVSRTGYTGEDGFEIILPWESAPALWDELISDDRVLPAGLGARDTLRLEKGMLLSGTDFDGSQTPLQTGPPWVVKFNRQFIGREALERQYREGGYQVLTGLVMEGRGVPRNGYPVLHRGEEAGTVTSGTMSPMLEKGIALAYLPPGLTEEGTSVEVSIRGRGHAARVKRPPFV